MRILFTALFIIVLKAFLISQNGITISKVLGGVSIPVDITNCGDDRIFVIEKPGKIRIIQNDKLVATPYLDIVNKVRSSGNEQGLLGMAFHPDYKNNGFVYVNYTNRDNPTLTVIERYKVTTDKNKADSTSGKILLTFEQPYANHNGGCLKFGKDGYLYIGTGDGGSANDPLDNGQNKKVRLGKILRIDVDTAIGFKIPKTNPFINDTNYLKEIYNIGMRNPWRFSFDRLTGDLWIGDVGQDTWEEVDFEASPLKGGKNYGWRCYEGNHPFNQSGCGPKSNYNFPLHEYLSDENTLGCSVTGGYVYRGDKYPSLYGKYIYCDYCSGRIWAIVRTNDSVYTNTQVYDYASNSITTFGEDAQGTIYFADAATSSIYRIGDTCKFSINVISKDPSCHGVADGSAKTNLGNGTAAKFIWSTGDSLAEIKNLSPGTYHVKVIYNQCLSETDFTISDKLQDTACMTQKKDTAICLGNTISLSSCDQSNALSFQWYRDNFKITGEDKKQLTVKDPGSYQLEFTDSSGCISARAQVIQITVHPLPSTPQIVIHNDTLFATNGFTNYNWYLNGMFIGNSTVNFWIALLGGKYSVDVKDSFDCQSALSLSVDYVKVKTENEQSIIKLFSLHPNPVQDFLIIESASTLFLNKLNYQIITIQNKVIRESGISNFKDSAKIEVSDLMPGMYLILLQNGKKEEKLPFIKVGK